MFYYLYKITNLISGKIYIGVHQTKDLDDGYLGSGSHISAAIKKYGKENFCKEILEFFDNMNDMFIKERKVVNEDFLKRDDVYNKVLGGHGGSPKGNGFTFKGCNHSEETKQRLKESKVNFKHSEQTKRLLSENNWSKRDPKAHSESSRLANEGKSKSDEHKEKIRQSLLGKKRGKQEELICPHCGVSGGKGIMKRWHFDKCKSIVDVA